MPVPPVLLEVRRGALVESRHRGSLVLLAADGTIAVAAGAAEAPLFPRSSLKPFQAVAICDAGFAGSADDVALAAASHDGEQRHRDGVRAILAAAGLGESALGCPADLPGSRAALQEWVAGGGQPSRLCHNCSGKHAAMLAACVANGWDLASYLEPSHPLQRLVRDTIERICAEPVRSSTVDGCGAPAHAITLVGLARGFAALAVASDGTATARVRDAMTAHPQLVGGTGRPVTELMAGVPGLVCKDGAEGVWGAALPDGRAFAAKAEDGGARVLGPLLAAALRHWGIGAPAVTAWSAVPVLGGGQPVGELHWSAGLRELLAL